MSSMMIGALGAAFSVSLMLGLWGEEASGGLVLLGWVPAALGLLRAEVTTVQGLLVLLVTRPVRGCRLQALRWWRSVAGRSGSCSWLSLGRGLSAGGPGWPLTRPWLRLGSGWWGFSCRCPGRWVSGW